MAILRLSEIGPKKPVYQSMEARPNANARGYGYEWQQYSKEYRRQHPICSDCERAATELVDHKQPVTGPDDPLFWDPTNHQGLCWSCHSKKTRRQGGGRPGTKQKPGNNKKTRLS